MQAERNLIEILQEEIQVRMEDKNLTASELEKKAGLKMSAVRNILTGKSNNPGIEVLSAIARLLSCSVDELIGETKSQSYISTIADLNKTKLTHAWNLELYQDCLNAIQHQIQIKNFKPTMEQILFFVKEAYIYSLEGKENKADMRFTKWIVDTHC